jgi:hypothetical protein
VIQDELGDLLRDRAISGEFPIISPHAAVRAILAAEIGDFNHAANENFTAKPLSGGGVGSLVERRLACARGPQIAFVRKIGNIHRVN